MMRLRKISMLKAREGRCRLQPVRKRGLPDCQMDGIKAVAFKEVVLTQTLKPLRALSCWSKPPSAAEARAFGE